MVVVVVEGWDEQLLLLVCQRAAMLAVRQCQHWVSSPISICGKVLEIHSFDQLRIRALPCSIYTAHLYSALHILFIVIFCN